MKVERIERQLSPGEQAVISKGFSRHSTSNSAPEYSKRRVAWLGKNDDQTVVAALTADIVWDWMYVDELWVHESLRGSGFGKRLMMAAEAYAQKSELCGVWLWTQSWQAAEFYAHLGYIEFTRFADYPRGHERIGFRKEFSSCPELQ